eukprot:1698592-Amphidinium_carterae.1
MVVIATTPERKLPFKKTKSHPMRPPQMGRTSPKNAEQMHIQWASALRPCDLWPSCPAGGAPPP